MSWQTLLKTKTATWLLTAVLLIVAFISFRMYLQKKEVDAEINKLEQQAENIKNDNERLSGLIKYLNTPEYQEKAAREQLNLKKEGEFVVVLPTGNPGEVAGQSNEQDKSNPEKWFDYFFSN
ncbi:MAG: hypothetical protein A3B10_01145 [Candidatus Doudnabacteria bacterium RIFCSPLOWO2_01_FULL_44_21]|uniref:Septum formation initiator n=1 Tax=Candidatus Doudnabacteria bacterium RIFCSPLOWO2_01_FULL_44_21 TaxID=1817841 RepID=A0A1F5PXF9_9BACT|nr:MAG: hypothetical protein A3B95_04055 [Candidatus Doudnabacteria bacterium RIFCSPHIGHO2_02_FULL_43_13b]OGE94392.1 MAG: hypothetical protein A3B10_01145 [Candidatus Doudnabacteria bacterium RIFCSPLOWO2_01_FULL_44_21]